MDNNYLFGTQFTLSENLFFLIIIEKLIVIGSYLMVGGGCYASPGHTKIENLKWKYIYCHSSKIDFMKRDSKMIKSKNQSLTQTCRNISLIFLTASSLQMEQFQGRCFCSPFISCLSLSAQTVHNTEDFIYVIKVVGIGFFSYFG